MAVQRPFSIGNPGGRSSACIGFLVDAEDDGMGGGSTKADDVLSSSANQVVGELKACTDAAEPRPRQTVAPRTADPPARPSPTRSRVGGLVWRNVVVNEPPDRRSGLGAGGRCEGRSSGVNPRIPSRIRCFLPVRRNVVLADGAATALALLPSRSARRSGRARRALAGRCEPHDRVETGPDQRV